MRRSSMLAVALCAFAGWAASAPAAGGVDAGNSVNAQRCAKDGWQSLYDRGGRPFAIGGACTAYGAQGGQILTPGALPCLQDGWSALGQTTSAPFASEQACVDFALGGGTPVHVVPSADLSLSVTFQSPSVAVLSITNSGPATATNVTVRYPLLDGGAVRFPYAAGWTPQLVFLPKNAFAIDVSTQSLPVGTSTILRFTQTAAGTSSTWTVEVFASDQPDPDSTPNDGVTTEDDYVTFTITD